ncbi:MAG: N-acetylmuramoyl-L-alanine amidase [Fuerstiella sp.]|nr:N-acetylmuramoyl-L-alanine amidase [Fuerstiella sp.]
MVHHSATKRGSVESIHRNHRNRRDRNGQPWLGIGYHFVIGNGNGMPDGSISPTFRWKQQLHGAHSGSLLHNGRGIGICLIGNFEEEPPTAAQLTSITSLIRTLTVRFKIRKEKVIGHRSVRATACPGRLFPLKEIVNEAMPSNLTFIPTR